MQSRSIIAFFSLLFVALFSGYADEPLNQKLWEAIKQGDVESVARFVESGADATAVIEKGKTSTTLAAEEGNLEVLKLLLEDEESLSRTDAYGFGLLSLASKRGHLDLVKYLLDRGMDIDAPSGYRFQTPLMAAAEGGNLEVVKFLVEKGADVGYANQTGQSVIMGAKGGDLVRYLVEQGAEISRKNELGFTATTFAVFNGNQESLKALLELGADPYSEARHGEPILYEAIRQGWNDLSKIIIEAGFSLEKETYGTTPFQAAAKAGQLELLRYMVSKGVNPKDQPQAIILAAVQGRTDTVEWLLNEGIPVDYQDARFGQSPLYIAVSNQKIETVKLLLENGANVELQDKRGTSPLSKAVQIKNAELVALLEE
ncbi:ankyrin repeat domain-containing protein [Puniceicoccaceae bacterium K14]|nr:ankyrin repeat domain-containing protein [Puniceicoccaceae bacterium K14]